MRHCLNTVLTLSAILICSLTAWSRNISLYSLTTNEGLSHIKVNDVYTDEHGMIWAGTEDRKSVV